MKRVALFPGTFDPFTKGHHSIVMRALQACADEVIVAIGINDSKRPLFTIEERVAALKEIFKDEPRVSVATYSCVTADFATEIGATTIVRGIRSAMDFEFEKAIADVNKKLTGVETLILITELEFAHISSTIVRDLIRFGKDISDFVPNPKVLEDCMHLKPVK
ncbi:MAG: pantetheine-phosphate adenylyltransferase [Bacteroidales bacterium]